MKTENAIDWFLNGDNIDMNAYQRGMEDCHELNEIPCGSNPYEKNTVEWFSYNKGWNAYEPKEHKCTLEEAQGMKCFNPCGECR